MMVAAAPSGSQPVGWHRRRPRRPRRGTLAWPLTERASIALEDRRLAPDAPDLAERVAHLAHRHVGAGGVDDRRHQVAAVARGVLASARASAASTAGRVAPRAQRLDALDLLPLERRVDLEDLERLLVLELRSG